MTSTCSRGASSCRREPPKSERRPQNPSRRLCRQPSRRGIRRCSADRSRRRPKEPEVGQKGKPEKGNQEGGNGKRERGTVRAVPLFGSHGWIPIPIPEVLVCLFPFPCSRFVAVQWRVGDKVLNIDRPLVMGILNVTPDSFSDGGRFFSPGAAAGHALRMLEEGADIIDIGGESTRPQAAVPVPQEVELDRVLPVIERIFRDRRDAVVS